MPSCCSIQINQEFDVVVMGTDMLGIAIAFHTCSYGLRTALVNKQKADNELISFVVDFKSYIEQDYAMPQNIRQLNNDSHLTIIYGEPNLFNDILIVDEDEIKSRIIIIHKNDIDNSRKFFLENDKVITKISDKLWLRSNLDNRKEIWECAQKITEQIVSDIF